jgi:hypothetical protein
MVKKVAPPTVSVDLTDTAHVRAQGLQLLTPLTQGVNTLRVITATDYLDADEWLGRVRNARAKWKAMLDPISAPIARMKADLKLAETGVKRLNAEVDEPLATLELRVKDAMRQFKLEEQRQLQAAREQEEREERERQRQLEEVRRKEEAAKTAPMRAKLADARAKLEAEQEAAATEVVDLNPIVKGASSSVRTSRKPRITDLGAFISAIADYAPQAGIYRMGQPPLSMLTPEMFQSALTAMWRAQPGVVESWPGVEVIEDITIAGR